MDILLYLGLGAVAGLLGGLLGVGGGIVVVPVLLYTFRAQGFAPEVLTHMAVGTSLATIVVTSISAIRTHHKKGAVDWSLVRILAPSLVIGSIAGSLIAHQMQGRLLEILFGAFAILVSLQMLSGKQASGHSDLPGPAGLWSAGGLIGTGSSIFGIGGGSLTVPYLSWHKVPMQIAVATSSACGLPIALAGTIGFIVNGWHVPEQAASSLGYVYLPALTGIGLSSLIFAGLGAKLAHRLPAATLKKVFAGVLLAVGLEIIFGLR